MSDIRVGDAVAFAHDGTRVVAVVMDVTTGPFGTVLIATTGFARFHVFPREVLEVLKGHRSADATARERGAE